MGAFWSASFRQIYRRPPIQGPTAKPICVHCVFVLLNAADGFCFLVQPLRLSVSKGLRCVLHSLLARRQMCFMPHSVCRSGVQRCAGWSGCTSTAAAPGIHFLLTFVILQFVQPLRTWFRTRRPWMKTTGAGMRRCRSLCAIADWQVLHAPEKQSLVTCTSIPSAVHKSNFCAVCALADKHPPGYRARAGQLRASPSASTCVSHSTCPLTLAPPSRTLNNPHHRI